MIMTAGADICQAATGNSEWLTLKVIHLQDQNLKYFASKGRVLESTAPAG